jgi:hypothetical protein
MEVAGPGDIFGRTVSSLRWREPLSSAWLWREPSSFLGRFEKDMAGPVGVSWREIGSLLWREERAKTGLPVALDLVTLWRNDDSLVTADSDSDSSPSESPDEEVYDDDDDDVPLASLPDDVYDDEESSPDDPEELLLSLPDPDDEYDDEELAELEADPWLLPDGDGDALRNARLLVCPSSCFLCESGAWVSCDVPLRVEKDMPGWSACGVPSNRSFWCLAALLFLL